MPLPSQFFSQFYSRHQLIIVNHEFPAREYLDKQTRETLSRGNQVRKPLYRTMQADNMKTFVIIRLWIICICSHPW